MDTSMWGKALRVMPRLNKAEWDKLDIVAKWLVATRSAALVLSFMASAIGGILAAKAGAFSLGPWLLVTVGLVFAHGTNNLLNDLVDYVKGVDRGNYFRAQYGPQPLESGLMTKPQLLLWAAVTGLVAASCGLVLVVWGWESRPLILPLMLIGAFFVLFYTFPLKYVGLGELAVLLVWGPLMIAGAYYVLTGDWSWSVVAASFPFGLGVAAAIFGKHIDKYKPDKEKGIHTLPVVIGERNARYGAVAMMALQYLVVIALVVTRFFTPAMLIVLLAVPSLYRILPLFRYPRPDGRPDFIPEDVWPLYFVAVSFDHSRRFGGVFLLGLLVDMALHLILGW